MRRKDSGKGATHPQFPGEPAVSGGLIQKEPVIYMRRGRKAALWLAVCLALAAVFQGNVANAATDMSDVAIAMAVADGKRDLADEGGEPAAEAATGGAATGRIRNVYLHNKDNIIPADYDREFFRVGDHGVLTFSGEHIDNMAPGAPSSAIEGMRSFESGDSYEGTEISYSVDKPEILTIDKTNHLYRILAGGEATVIITAKIKVEDPTESTGYREERWLAKFTFIIMGDARGTSLSKKIVTTYMVYDTIGAADVELIDCPDLKYYSFDYRSSNSEMLVDVSLDPIDKKVHIQSYVEGTSTITLILNGSELKLKFINKLTSISTDHHVMDVGDDFVIKILKYKGSFKWRSTRPSVATVSKSGIVRGKNVGNTVIYARFKGLTGTQRIGCAVSVVKKGRTKVLKKAIRIGDTCSYSQPMRMQKGYYDCSSLVWRAYAQIGKYFGLRKYAPTAAEEARWCAAKGRILGEWDYDKIQDMVYRPGDVLFRTGARNGRYLGIYHVEMFAGYKVIGFDGDEPMLSMCWANRPDNYYEPCGDIFGRP